MASKRAFLLELHPTRSHREKYLRPLLRGLKRPMLDRMEIPTPAHLAAVLVAAAGLLTALAQLVTAIGAVD